MVFLCRLNFLHFLRSGQHDCNRKRAGRVVRQLATIKGLNPGNFLIVLQFNQLILKYGILNSGEVNVESASKVGTCQDKNSAVPALGPMATQLYWLLRKGFVP